VIEEVVREVAPDAASMDIDLISDLPWPSDAQAAVRMSRPPMENARSTPSSSSTAIHFMDLPPELRKVFDAFGRDRIFRGPDLTRLPCIHHECVKHFAHSLLFLSGRDRARVMVEALLDWTERPA